jgi:hypothetical protein
MRKQFLVAVGCIVATVASAQEWRAAADQWRSCADAAVVRYSEGALQGSSYSFDRLGVFAAP